jgi:UDP-N-acetylmuramate--L-alanine ligase
MAPKDKVHFIGIGGAGMSALAQFHRLGGGMVTGSDRAFDRGENKELRDAFDEMGIKIFPQDGSGIDGKTRRVVLSTAIEDDNPELQRAKEVGATIVHRTDVLAEHVKAHRTIAVAGTSGKSTVTAMVFEILEAAGQAPSVITGAGLYALRERGLYGNAYRGDSDILVIEADESDGTLPKYRPWVGLLLNVSKDHKSLEELAEIFSEFKRHCTKFVVNADHENLREYVEGSATYGFSSGDLRASEPELEKMSSLFMIDELQFSIPAPGRHNAMNALAATAAARAAGVPLAQSAAALKEFRGVDRRFRLVGTARGVNVIDDYAHNPDKVRAVIAAARLGAKRLRVVFQPHGFAPTRFVKAELITAFTEALAEEDILWLPEIYYAGGTAAKDISSQDLADPIRAAGRDARFALDREALLQDLAKACQHGDAVLVLGARDPGLSAYARRALEALG